MWAENWAVEAWRKLFHGLDWDVAHIHIDKVRVWLTLTFYFTAKAVLNTQKNVSAKTASQLLTFW